MLCLVRYLFVTSTSVIDCLGRFVPEMTYCVEWDVKPCSTQLGRRPLELDPQGRETRTSQEGPRDTEEDRPELGPPGDRSRFTEKADLGNGERWSTRDADDVLPGHDRTGLRAQTSSRYSLHMALVEIC